MTTTVTVKLEGVNVVIKSMMTNVANQILRPALKAGAEVVASRYRQMLLDAYAKVGNTGTHAFEAVGVKSRAFKDELGAYAVVGAKTIGGQMMAPQMRFGEKGTDERYTRTGKYRGAMPAQRWLKLSLAQSMSEAQAVILARIRSRVGGRT